MKLKEITELKDLKGKTIADTLESHGKLWIKFTDDSFVVLEADEESDGYGYSSYTIDVGGWSPKQADDRELYDLGIVSKKEHEAAVLVEEEAMERRMAEREAEAQARDREYELEQLRLLQSKYPNS